MPTIAADPGAAPGRTKGGGVLINQAIHAIDLLIWLAGLPERVTARTRTLNHAIEVEDAALAILEYADGRLGLIQATTIGLPRLSRAVGVLRLPAAPSTTRARPGSIGA